MNEPKTVSKRFIALCILGSFMLVIILISIFSGSSATGTITIISDPDSELYFATSEVGEFKELKQNTTSVNAEPGKYFLLSRSGDRTSANGTFVTAGEEYTLDVTTNNETQSAEELFEGSINFGFIQGEEVAGITPESSSLINFGIVDRIYPDPTLSSLPYARNVHFWNLDNYIYSSFTRGVGVVRNNKSLVDSQLNSLVPSLSDALHIAGETDGENVSILNKDGSVWEAGRLVESAEKLGSVNVSEINFLAMSSGATIHAHTPIPANYDDPEEGDTISEFTIFSANDSYKIPSIISNVSSAILADGYLIASGSQRIVKYGNDGSIISSSAVYGHSDLSLLQTNDTLYALSTTGLWILDAETMRLQQIKGFGLNEWGIRDSLSSTERGVIFSTSIVDDEGNPLTSGSTYLVNR